MPRSIGKSTEGFHGAATQDAIPLCGASGGWENTSVSFGTGAGSCHLE